MQYARLGEVALEVCGIYLYFFKNSWSSAAARLVSQKLRMMLLCLLTAV